MLSTRQRFIFTTLAFLALDTFSVAGFRWGDGGPGRWDGDGGWSGCPWGAGAGGCSNDGNDNNESGGDSSSTDPTQLEFTASAGARYDKIITIHAVLACLVWVLYELLPSIWCEDQLTVNSFIPLGGILIRSGLKTHALLKLHAVLQSMSYLLYIVAAAMGIYLVKEFSSSNYSMWSDPHTKLGVAILALAFMMPVLGTVHHSMYKKKAVQYKEGGERPGRTVPGYAHLWGGRILIVLGMVNGGLGIRLASNSPFSNNSDKKMIAYSVAAAIMFTLYAIFVILGERRRSKERQESRADDRGIPMVAPAYEPAQAAGPPSYEQSQSSLSSSAAPKQVEATARYT